MKTSLQTEPQNGDPLKTNIHLYSASTAAVVIKDKSGLERRRWAGSRNGQISAELAPNKKIGAVDVGAKGTAGGKVRRGKKGSSNPETDERALSYLPVGKKKDPRLISLPLGGGPNWGGKTKTGEDRGTEGVEGSFFFEKGEEGGIYGEGKPLKQPDTKANPRFISCCEMAWDFSPQPCCYESSGSKDTRTLL